MNGFPPNINPEIFTLTAVIVGLILEDDYTPSELNAIGNWLILVGQITITTAAQQQLLNNRNNNSTVNSFESNNSPIINSNEMSMNDINNLILRISELERDVDTLKKR